MMSGVKKKITNEEPIFRDMVSRIGLARCGKSCRLQWVNYLKPGVKRGNYRKEEEDLIIQLHAKLGNRWSAIASKVPGRTDNDIKNYWHSHMKKRNKRYAAETGMITKESCKNSSTSEVSQKEEQPYQMQTLIRRG
ncbi:unnamed protein product [Fraxinus pennsylvanica]|uniref:Uncharacterized protein n=1 Tax=Fraxinus pennsylvanica TaxID=56036 RepID=A0AAD2E521_9LAMI|nr:unnamed protein product [Fraxinus pennsylvanica]